MTITFTIDPSWLRHGDALARVLDHCRALSAPAPWAPPPPPRQPGDDGDDGLAQLLEGVDTPEPTPAPVKAPTPPAPAIPGLSTPSAPIVTGAGLYKWAASAKALPAVNKIGRRLGAPRLVTEWSPDQVAAAVRELTSTPIANGPTR
jgi:hypothetical protein